MKSLKNIFSILSIGVLIFSTMGFSVSRHYCKGMLVEESFYSLADTCEDEYEEEGSHLKKSCCEDESLVLSGIEVFHIIKKNFDAKSLEAPLCDFYKATSHVLVVLPLKNILPWVKPPPIYNGKSILIKIQRFLL